MKIAVYTCITNSYAPLVVPAVVSDGVGYLCFSDGTMDDVWPWKFRPLKPFFANPIRNARLPKILSHRYLADYDFTIWLDASLQLIVEPRQIIEAMGQRDFAAFVNPRRSSMCDEFRAIRESKWSRKDRVPEDILNEQAKRYGEYPSRIYYGGLIARKNCLQIQFFEEDWFGEYCVWQHRDLPAMNYTLENRRISSNKLPGDIKNNEFTKWVKT